MARTRKGNKPLPPIAEIRRLFKVTEDNTGIERICDIPGTVARKGHRFPSVRPSGSRGLVTINGADYLVSRVIYALHFGVDPGEKVVRHVNDDPTNNSRPNLLLGTQRDNSVDFSLNSGRDQDDLNIKEVSPQKFQGRFYVKEHKRDAVISATSRELCRARLDAEMEKYKSDPDNYEMPSLTNATGLRWVTPVSNGFIGQFTHKKELHTTPAFDTPKEAQNAIIAIRRKMDLPIPTDLSRKVS